MIEQEKLKEYIQKYRNKKDQNSYFLFLKEIDTYIKKSLFTKISNPELLEDTAQEIILGIHKSLHTYDLDCALLPWINSIIFHKTIDFYRKQSKFKDSLNIDSIELDSGQIKQEEFVLFKEVLEKLAKDVFGNSFIQGKLMGHSISEISKNSNLSESNVKVKLHRVAAKIKKAFL
ncbi:MAG: sigma-70 family RNA polymerase sigma factor [Bacteriovoracaceae bacterium]|jgi:RNA polymerase sigma-70 factor (ECF subfamily)|nr:sigma-70 family RNA polymerase sigma factor [Bacteriovoracaceae bacterium]